MHETTKIPLIVIAGPTATGKSGFACEIGRRIGGEVVSADSMQVYRYMDIGTAKVTLEEQMGVPHHLIDVIDPTDEMDAARYAELAEKAIREIDARGHVPILCGGTGFYIQAVTKKIDFSRAAPDEAYRRSLAGYAALHGSEALHQRLAEVDPASAAAIHPNNIKRVIRAMEFFHETGTSIAAHNESEHEKGTPYRLIFFFLDDDRAELYRRIDRRVDFMMEEGLADEVAYLKAMGLDRSFVSMQAIGYKEILAAMDGAFTMEEAVRIIKRESRHYAKRQETWFKREKDAIRIDRSAYAEDDGRILNVMLSVIEERTGIRAKEVKAPNT